MDTSWTMDEASPEYLDWLERAEAARKQFDTARADAARHRGQLRAARQLACLALSEADSKDISLLRIPDEETPIAGAMDRYISMRALVATDAQKIEEAGKQLINIMNALPTAVDLPNPVPLLLPEEAAANTSS